jgi:hypothetical protein
MNRREALIRIGGVGALGGGLFFGGALYGSSDVHIEPTDDSTIVRQDGEQIDSLLHAATLVKDDDALLGISVPDRSTVQKVAVEVVWAIRQDRLWSDIRVDLVVTGDVWAEFNSGVATAYDSPWGSSPSEADASTPSHRRYVYPIGTTAGYVESLLTLLENTGSEKKVVELEARLSARSLGGTHVELTAPAELSYYLE